MTFLRTTALLLFFPLSLCAQRYYPTAVQSRELLSISGGTTSFYGDIAPRTSLLGSGPQLGISYEYKVLPQLGLRLSGTWYRLQASDEVSKHSYLQDRNLSFTASNWELSLLTAVYMLPWKSVYFKSRRRFNAYGLLGAGITYYTPKAELENKKWDLRSMKTEGVHYSKTTLVIPFGGGLQYKVTPQLDLALQLTYHYSFSDYLDDVSTFYRAQESFSTPLAASLADRRPELGLPNEPAGAMRGNPKVRDGYSMLSLRLQYHLMRYHYMGKEVKKLFQ